MAKHLRILTYDAAFTRFQQNREPRVGKIIAEARKRGDAKHSLSPGAARIRDFILGTFLRLRGKRMFDEVYGHAIDWN